MKAWESYFDVMQGVIDKIKQTQGDNIMRAAELLAKTTEQGGLIYGFGVGHSYHVIGDAFWRASTPANYYAIVEQSATGSTEITKSNWVENTYDLGRYVVDYHRITPNDCMIIISNSGNNIMPVDAAIRAKEKGIPVIAITAVDYSEYLKTRHRDNVKLKDIADVVLDNCSLIGDAAVEIDGFGMKVGATSTIPNVFLQNVILCQMVELLVEKGIEPDVYYNGHLTLMDEKYTKHNQKMVDKYFYKIRNL
ncbi:putative phosphosugar-binding protein [Breznakia sp. PF5-3]|uniref:sugar isomerase domain-containing protein n=1 Tax=unclassified Breznakia TaxID=2623764 RepID=UPI0024068DD4|nr:MULTISPECIES: sugar isomerase domain-containing protein [unclassified Breznakia]MDF9824441.1 putative phosphosugar-binding protein [Breznakia sp. PM6-1]MDF9835277.1 putative phosphosugar-binding protein [Breznakia sp. PF5-3]MDF9837396.1 putative phosphosugar-binding protein [Breznakia sp. PFB2-8]MDF9859331.1 putative phosphosugar-binding protein [Breznakia sp. PH5-24]